MSLAAAKKQVLNVLKLELAPLTQTITHPLVAGPPTGEEPMVQEFPDIKETDFGQSSLSLVRDVSTVAPMSWKCQSAPICG